LIKHKKTAFGRFSRRTGTRRGWRQGPSENEAAARIKSAIAARSICKSCTCIGHFGWQGLTDGYPFQLLEGGSFKVQAAILQATIANIR
jgi:hypothetical protein